MAYNLADLRNRVINDKLADPDYEPAIINRFLDDAQKEVFTRFELPQQEKTYVGDLPAGSSIFTFPDDYQQAQSMVLSSDTRTWDISDAYLSFRDFNLRYPNPNGSTGEPRNWTIYARKIMFDRKTDDIYTLSMFYLKTPATLDSDDDVPEVPEDFAELIVLGAYYRVLQRNEDFDQAAFIKNNEYEPLANRLYERHARRQSVAPTVIGRPLQRRIQRRTRA